MSDAQLKPCPFCGGEAIAITGPVKTLWGATCIRCSCWLDDRAPTSAEAITAWNTRAEAAEAALARAYMAGRDDAATVAYRVCAETRHVILGTKAEEAILALPVPADLAKRVGVNHE